MPKYPILVSLVITIFAGCADQPDLPPLQAETEHFLIHHREEIQLCEGLFDQLEELTLIGEAFGVSPNKTIPIYLYNDEDDLKNNGCLSSDSDADGCFYQNQKTVHINADSQSSWEVLRHEVTHAYASEKGSPPPFFSEGLAAMLECRGDYQFYNELLIEYSIEELGETSAIEALREFIVFLIPESNWKAESCAVTYALAGGIVQHLVQLEGLDTFFDFYRRVHRKAGISEVNTALRNVYGADFESLLETWIQERIAQPSSPVCLPITQCASPSFPIETEETLEMNCTWYGIDSDDPVEFRTTRTIDLTETTSFHLSPSGFSIGSCSGNETSLNTYSPRETENSLSQVWSTLPEDQYWIQTQQEYEPLQGETRESVGTISTTENIFGIVGNQGVQTLEPGVMQVIITPLEFHVLDCNEGFCRFEILIVAEEETLLERWEIDVDGIQVEAQTFEEKQSEVRAFIDATICNEQNPLDCLELGINGLSQDCTNISEPCTVTETWFFPENTWFSSETTYRISWLSPESSSHQISLEFATE